MSSEAEKLLRRDYDNWIFKRYPSRKEAYGKCQSATKEMQKSYSWLTRVRGVAHYLGGEAPHWWLKCPILEEIVDPTAKQFGVISFWEELPDDDPRCKYPRRKCMNCGEVYYNDKPIFGCSLQCERELEADFN